MTIGISHPEMSILFNKGEELNNVKKILLQLAKPVVMPITRMILNKYYSRDENLSTLEEERVLILAPHVDDETIGIGGTIINHVQRGHHVVCVYMTDGSRSVTSLSKEMLVAERKKEALTVKEILGINEVYFLNFPDGGVQSTPATQAKLLSIITKVSPDVIYCPTIVDCHEDHIATARILADIFKKYTHLAPIVRLYEINCPIPPDEINCIIDITPFQQNKIKAMDVFRSQVIDFDGFIELSKIKTNLVKKSQITAVETFLELDSADFVARFTCLDKKQYKFGNIFKQVNKATTLLWGILQKEKHKQQMYRDCKQSGKVLKRKE